MKIAVDKKRFLLYAWVGLAYYMIWLIGEAIKYPETFEVRAINEAWRAVYIIVLNFTLFEYTILQATRKTILLFILLLFAHLLLYSFGMYSWRYIGIRLHIYTEIKKFGTIKEGVYYHFPYAVISVFFFGIVRHIYNYIELNRAAQQLRIEKQQAELNYLKSQTNPHFLFNTLNNIYSLARDKSDLAPESILKLSKILRFMLYETGGAFIPIEQELKIIKDYIALEQLRYDDSLHIDLKYELEDMKQPLPPLLLIPLVENAFKHGVSETRSRPYVNIHLSINKQQLNFIVKNSTEKIAEWTGVKENIGLSNLRRQLELLYTDFDLITRQGETEFSATLRINLASHV